MSVMGETARRIVHIILEFQFFMAQFMAIVLLSDVLSSELRKGTLEVLLTTRVRAFEIVLGKLLGGVLPIVTVIVVSVPLLGLVRWWGGVVWAYVVIRSSVTLSAALLLGAITLVGSMYVRHSHRLIIILTVFLVAVNFVSPMLAVYNMLNGFPGWLQQTIRIINPYTMNSDINQYFFQNVAQGQPQWILHLLISLGGTSVLLLFAAWRLRACVYSTSTTGWIASHFGMKRKRVRHATESCLLWLKLGGTPVQEILRHAWPYCVVGIPLLAAGIKCIETGPVGTRFHLLLAGIKGFWVVGAFVTISTAAMTIAQDKDRRVWPVLLTTPLTNGRIVYDLARVTVFRHLAGWGLLYGSSLLYWWVVYAKNDLRSSFDMYFQLAVTLVELPIYLTLMIGVGMWLGLRCKTGQMAVMAALAFVACHYIFEEHIFWNLASLRFRATNPTHRIVLQALVRGTDLALGVTGLLLTHKTLRRHCL